MQSVGKNLRTARLAQGRSLEQIHSSTRISLKILEAIEADQVSSISSPFLYRSFVRQIADYLAVDYSSLSASVQAEADRIPAPLVPGECTRPTPKVAALRLGQPRKVRWLRSISSFAGALVACSAVYALWQNTKLNLPLMWDNVRRAPLTALSRPAAEPTTSAPRSEARAAAHPAAVPSAPQTRQPEVKAEQAGFTLELSATEPAWLSIVADGKISFKGILEKAETKVLEGHRSARIRTGNAGAVEAVFNGKSLGALGSRGQVRTVLFTKNAYEVIRAAPRVSFFRFSPTFESAQLLAPRALRLPDF
jgi:cytoskeleton protein RodZ